MKLHWRCLKICVTLLNRWFHRFRLRRLARLHLADVKILGITQLKQQKSKFLEDSNIVFLPQCKFFVKSPHHIKNTVTNSWLTHNTLTIFLLFIDFVPFFLIARLKFSTALPRSRWRQITLRPLCTVVAATQYAPFSPVSKRPNFCGQYLAFFCPVIAS